MIISYHIFRFVFVFVVFVFVVVVLKISSFHALCPYCLLLLCSSEENNLVRKDLKNIFLLLWLDFRQKQQPKEKERGVCQFAKRKKAFFIFVLKYSYGLRACAAI